MKKSLERVVVPELLDILPPQDHRALRSRRDLRRLNQWMNHPCLMARSLLENLDGVSSPRIVEIGAGDGDFLLSVAGRLRQRWPDAEAKLVDRLDVFNPEICYRFKDFGWRIRTELAEVLPWLQQSPPNSADAILSNLFLHQFHRDELAEMLRQAALITRSFIALEPRRSWLPRLCGHCLWVIGCNSVTRHDANISIRAGFSGRELSALWPDNKNWELAERPAGLFSHLFIARRKD
jgi:hypothetical protein